MAIPNKSGCRMRKVRGTSLDIFSRSSERRQERAMIADYERVLDEIAERLTAGNHDTAVALAALPLEVKGFGHVKLANAERARQRQAVLLAKLRTPSAPVKVAAE